MTSKITVRRGPSDDAPTVAWDDVSHGTAFCGTPVVDVVRGRVVYATGVYLKFRDDLVAVDVRYDGSASSCPLADHWSGVVRVRDYRPVDLEIVVRERS